MKRVGISHEVDAMISVPCNRIDCMFPVPHCAAPLPPAMLPAGYMYGVGDGTLENTAAPVNVSGGHEFTRIAAGSSHTCALDTGGRAWCWGAYSGALAVLLCMRGFQP